MEIIKDPDAVNRNPETSLTDGASTLSGSALGLLERPLIPVGIRMAELNPTCSDLDSGTMVWPKKFLHSVYSHHPVLKEGGLACSSGIQYCNYDTEDGIAMRQWCSHTCGCNRANSSLILSTQTMGCPDSCWESRLYEATLSEAPCVDQEKTSPAFAEYIQGVRYLRDSYAKLPDWFDMFNSWVSGLELGGCEGHVILNPNGGFFGDLCGKTPFNLKPLQHLCPVTCQCSDPFTRAPSGQPDLCPRSCIRS